MLATLTFYSVTTVSRQFTVREALHQFFESDEEEIEVEPEREEDVSVMEENIDPDFDPDLYETDQSTDE